MEFENKRYVVGKTDPTGKHYGIGVVLPLIEWPPAEYDTKEEAVLKLEATKKKDPKLKTLIYVVLDRETGEFIT